MHSAQLILVLGLGMAAEVLAFVVLNRVFRLAGGSAAAIVAMLVLLVYVPWGILHWPGADVFAILLAVFLTLAYVLAVVGWRGGRRWHWGPALLVTFFITVVASNLVFLGVAERGISGIFEAILPAPSQGGEVAASRFPGTVARDFQEKEAQYNAYLARLQAQQDRGWQVRQGWREVPDAGAPASFLLAVDDAQGSPVSGATVAGRFLRPSDSREDVSFAMQEIDPGLYEAQLALPLPGNWRLVAEIVRGDDHHEIRAMTSVRVP